MASLASLVVDLQLESAKLRAGLDESNRRLESFGKKAEAIGNKISLAFGAKLAVEAVSGLARFVYAGSEAVAGMGDMAQAAGTTTEEFSALAYAAQLSGTSTEEMGSALKKLSGTMADAYAGGKAAEVFKVLGVEIEDANGKLRSSTDVFGDVAEAMSKLEDGAAKTELATRLMGKSGADLIPLMNGGKDAIAAATEEARTFGHIISEETADQAEDFNKSVARLGFAAKGVAAAVAADVAPQFSALAEKWVESAKTSGVFEGAVTVLSTTLRALATGAIVVKHAFTAIGQAIAFAAYAAQEYAAGRHGNILLALEQLGKESAKSIEATVAEFHAIWDKATGPLATQEPKEEGAAERMIAHLASVDAAQKKSEKSAKDMAAWWERQLQAIQEYAEEAADVSRPDIEVGEVRGFTSLTPLLAQGTAAAEQAAREERASAREALINKGTGRMGNIMGLVESAQLGATAGGVWGAVGAVALDLLSQSSQFASIIEKLDSFIQEVADTLGLILGPALEEIGPLFGWVAGLLQTLAPVFELAGAVIGGLVSVVRGVIEGIAGAWNFIIDMVNELLGWMGVDLSKLKWVLRDLTEATEEQTDTATEAARANESLSNIPAGYKIALARFDAMNPESGGGAGSRGPAPIINNHIEIHAGDLSADEVLSAAEERIQRATGRGARLGGSRYAFLRDY